MTSKVTREVLRRVAAALVGLAMVAGQALCAPASALAAQRGGMTVATATDGGQGFCHFGSDSGTTVFCADPDQGDPTGHSYARWDWTGESSGATPADPHALAYLMWATDGGRSAGFATPGASTTLAVWLLCGMQPDWASGAYASPRGHISGNIYEGHGARVARQDAARIRAVADEARAHAGQAGPWDRASRVWYSPDGSVQSVVEVLPGGAIEVAKSDTDASMTKGNPLYSLAGAEYGVYRDEACTDRAARIVTGADGRGSAKGLRAGTYWVREDKAPAGHARSTEVLRADVASGATSRVDASDAPQSNPLGVVLAKADAETGLPSAIGGATLAGATFEVRYYAGAYDEASLPAEATRAWTVTTGDDGTADLSSATGDELYRDSSGEPCVPLGTVRIAEASAPEGYLPTGASWVVRVTGEGDAESVSTYAAPTVPEQAKRGDLRLVKAHGRTMARLAGVPFCITSLTTGEAHTIVTDANGQASTASSWASHAANTNANDRGGADPEAGVWFSGTTATETEPDDAKGALPYDRYRVEELRCAANRGLDLVSIEVSVTRDGTTVDLGTLDDGEAPAPAIRTTATDAADGDKWIDAGEGQAVTDLVSYENLEPGGEYELSGRLVDSETGRELARGTVPLVPEGASGTAEVSLTLDASGLEGHRLVCYETLSRDGDTVASHEDPDDEGQSVRVPSIGTTATDAEDGDHEAKASGRVRITDRIEYEGLVPGREYEATGRLVFGDSGEAVTGGDGEPVTATTRFTAESASGSVDVEFEFDGSSMAGRPVVAFETVSHEGRTVATHADLGDEGQTVTITGEDAPHEAPRGGGRLPQTGDDGPAAGALAALGVTGLLALAGARAIRGKGGSDE